MGNKIRPSTHVDIFLFFLGVVIVMNIVQTSGIPVGGLNVYELSARPWLYNLTQKYQKPINHLLDIPDAEWKAIKDLNFDVVFIMGVWQVGNYGLNFDRTTPSLLNHYSEVLPDVKQDDIIGSPYAVTSYTCNKQICNSDNDILSLKKKLNAMGLLLMLDYVPNHTAVDAEWATTNMDYYVRAPKGTSPSPNSYTANGLAYGSLGSDPWMDTLQINVFNPAARAARTAEVLHVASLSDGIRFDMAYLLLNSVFLQTWSTQLKSWGWATPTTEWWGEVVSTVKQKYPNTIFLAEVYSPYESALQNLGFDYTYDKVLRDKLKANNLDDIRKWIAGLSPQYIAKSVHYVSNHDEARGPAYFGSNAQSNAAASLLYTLPGARYYWMWDMYGFSNQLDIHLRREKSEPVVPSTESFYKTLLSVTSAPVFRQGKWVNLVVSSGNSDSSWRLIAYRWSFGDERRLCVINFSDTTGWGDVVLSDAQAGPNGDNIIVTELLTGQTYQKSATTLRTTGIIVGVNAWSAQILKY